jgi:hypothetical protein
MEVGNVQSTSFGMAYKRIVSKPELQAKYLNTCTAQQLQVLNASMNKATEALKATVFAHLHTEVNEDGKQLVHFIESAKPILNNDGKIALARTVIRTNDDIDKAIEATLAIDKTYQELNEALKPFAVEDKK